MAHDLGAGHEVYLYVIEGAADVAGGADDDRRRRGDLDETSVAIRADETTELIAVDVALDA